VLIHRTELAADSDIGTLVERLYRQYMNESVISVATLIVTPMVFLGRRRRGYLCAGRRDDILLAYGYAGPEDYYEELVGDLERYAREHHLRLNIMSIRRLEEVDDVTFTATPIGARQRLVDLASFTLAGSKMRRLRHAVNRFSSNGEPSTVEYPVGSDPDTDRAIVEMIDRWCRTRTQVNGSVRLFRRDIESRRIPDRHRFFLTYRDGALANVVVINRAEGGYLMDMEFYPADAPYGGLEFAIVNIIHVLRQEGCTLYSLGDTFGPEIESSPNADDGIRAMLEQMRGESDFGQGNLQFKNKFRPENRPIYLCQPAGGEPGDVSEVLMMIADPDIEAFMDAGPEDAGTASPEPAVAGQQARHRLLADYHYNVAGLPSDSVEYDLASDSWALLATPYIKERIGRLTGRPALSPVDALGEFFPFKHLFLTADGKSAESLLCRAWPGPRGYVLQTPLFPTYIFNQIENDFVPRECPDPGLLTARSDQVFKGNADPAALQRYIEGADATVSFVCMEVNNNASGGYAASLENLKAVRAICRRHAIPLFLDATRLLENALFIARHEPAQQGRVPGEIAREICRLADGVTASLTKDFRIDAGGVLATNLDELADAVNALQAGEAAPDPAAANRMALALQDRDDIERGVAQRVRATERLWHRLEQAGVPVFAPCGGHCVLIDVMQIPGFARLEAPLASFLAWLFETTGVRAGVHSAGMQKDTVLNGTVRLAVPAGMSEAEVEAAGAAIGAAFAAPGEARPLQVVGGRGFGVAEARYRPLEERPLPAGSDR
jgi:polyketide synthase PksN